MIKAKGKASFMNSSVIGTVIIILFTLLMTGIIYIKEPIGDDVLCAFEGSLTFYLDQYPDHLGGRLSSFGQVVNELKFLYLNWSGRIPGYAINYVGHTLPKLARAVITAVMYTSVCILTLYLAFQDKKKVLSHPFWFMVLYLALFWTKPGTFYTHMWTMSSIYVSAVLLCLGYWAADGNREKRRFWRIAGVQVLGILAGMAHEVISLCFIGLLGVQWLQDVSARKCKPTDLLRHCGLGVGYLIGFFAPGNFKRMGGSHDVITTDWITRISNSIYSHVTILLKGDAWTELPVLSLLVLACVSVVLLWRKHRKEKIWSELLSIGAGCCISVCIWSIMPRTPYYALDFWIVLVYLFIIKLLDKVWGEYRPMQLFHKASPLLLCMFLTWTYTEETIMYNKVALERYSRIEKAADEGMEEVFVSVYPQGSGYNRYFISYLNGQTEYDSECYQKYYGVHVIIEDD